MNNLDSIYELNLYQYYIHLVAGFLQGAEIDDNDHAVRLSSSLQRPELNAVLQTDIDENLDEVVETTRKFFGEKDLPYTWYLGPNTYPTDLKEQLEKKGYRHIGDDVIIGAELEEMVRNISTPNSLYIEEVDSDEDLETWVDIYTTVRNIKGGDVEMLKRVFQREEYLDEDLPWRKYLGWLNGEPVAASTLVMASGIAVVYDESLLPKFKGWGIENSINLVPLRKAKQKGYKIGLIPTSVGKIKEYTKEDLSELFRYNKLVDMEAGGGNRRRRRRRRRKRR